VQLVIFNCPGSAFLRIIQRR